MLTMGSQLSATQSIGGFINNIDSNQILTGTATGVTFNDNTLNGFNYPNNNEACTINGIPVYPTSGNSPGIPGGQGGTGIFTITPSAQILIEQDLSNTFAVTSEMLTKCGGEAGRIIAILIALLGPYPTSIATAQFQTVDVNAANQDVTHAVFNQSLISIPGFDIINFLVPAVSGTNIPRTQDAANAASGYT